MLEDYLTQAQKILNLAPPRIQAILRREPCAVGMIASEMMWADHCYRENNSKQAKKTTYRFAAAQNSIKKIRKEVSRSDRTVAIHHNIQKKTPKKLDFLFDNEHLDSTEREILNLKFVSNKNLKEVAELLDLPEKEIRDKYNTALTILREVCLQEI